MDATEEVCTRSEAGSLPKTKPDNLTADNSLSAIPPSAKL